MSAHTQGEWLVSDDEVGTVCHDDDKHFGMVVPHALVFGENKKADLRLIAAAPDLLQQLTDLLAMCNRQEDFNDDGDGRMFERAAAAIHKATEV